MPLHETTPPDQDRRPAWLRPILLPGLVALVLLIAGGVLVDRQSTVLDDERDRAAVMAEVALIRAKLEGNINSNIQLVRGLVATISTEPDMQQPRYSSLVANLFEEQSQLRSIAAARDLVVTMTYPLVDGDRAIGLDFRTNAAQRDAALRARDTGQLVLAGPVDLVQGGRGFVGRFPVFTDTPTGRRFWGVVSAVVDLDRLYADSGVVDPERNIEISISGVDATGSTRFFGDDLSDQNPVIAEVVLPSGAWESRRCRRGAGPLGRAMSGPCVACSLLRAP